MATTKLSKHQLPDQIAYTDEANTFQENVTFEKVVMLPSAPTADLQAATKKYVDDSALAAAAQNDLLDMAIIPTVTVGGIASGTTLAVGTPLESILRDILAPYVTSAFTSLSLSSTPSATTLECGDTITSLSATFAKNNDSEGQQPYQRYITGDAYNRDITAEASPYLGITPSVVLTAPGSKTWTISGKNKNNVAVTSQSATRSWQWMHYFGASALPNATAAEVSAILNSFTDKALASGKARNVTAAAANNVGTNYTYIAYAASFGDLAGIVMNGATPVLGAFTKLGDYSFTNSKGVVVSMRVYKSNVPGAFAAGATLNIS
jgi:hypothetical protein